VLSSVCTVINATGHFKRATTVQHAESTVSAVPCVTWLSEDPPVFAWLVDTEDIHNIWQSGSKKNPLVPQVVVAIASKIPST